MNLDESIFTTQDLSRRQFFRYSSSAAAAIAVMSVPGLSKGSAATGQSVAISVEECMALSPLEMGKRSSHVKNSFNYLIENATQISNNQIKSAVSELLNNPAPTLMNMYSSTGEKEKVRTRLVDSGYLKSDVTTALLLPPCSDPHKAPQSFFGAPGSGYMSHHSYPGGLAAHVAVNVKASMGFFHAYSDTFGFQLNKDIVIAAQTLHDLNKPWVFQWQEDGSCLPEQTIAGTGAHHIFSIAEAIYRGLPSELVVAMACAHNHPGTTEDEMQVVNWIKAACIVADKDPVNLEILAPGGETLPLPRKQEGFITHLGDHDFVLAVPAARWMTAILQDIATSSYGMSSSDLRTKKFNSLRNYIFSQHTILYLHHIWVNGGEKAFREIVQSTVTM